MVWYSHLFQNFPQFIVIHTVKGFGIVNKAEIDVFLELSCFFDDPADVGNLISRSSAFSKTSLTIWKFRVYVLLKPGLENFEHYFTSLWDEFNCAVVWVLVYVLVRNNFFYWFDELDQTKPKASRGLMPSILYFKLIVPTLCLFPLKAPFSQILTPFLPALLKDNVNNSFIKHNVLLGLKLLSSPGTSAFQWKSRIYLIGD